MADDREVVGSNPVETNFFFVLKKTNQPSYFGIFWYFIFFFIFLYIFFKIFFIFCVPRMPRTPRTVPRTPRCLALCKDPVLESDNHMTVIITRYREWYSIKRNLGIMAFFFFASFYFNLEFCFNLRLFPKDICWFWYWREL